MDKKKMWKCGIVLFSAISAIRPLVAGAAADSKVIDAVSRLVLRVERTYQLGPQLPQCCPGITTEYDVLNVLFGTIRDGTATDEAWKAVYHLRDIGDGAWYLEYEGAAYDVLRVSPTAYYERFLQGDDRAAMLLEQAFDWAIDQIEVGPGCEAGWKETAARSQQVLSATIEAISKAPTSGDWLPARRNTFLSRTRKLLEEWKQYVERHEGVCARQGDAR